MKYFIITKKQIMWCISALLAVIIATVGSVATFADTNRKLPIYCVETEKKQIAISFDAAWGNDDTEQLINILKEIDMNKMSPMVAFDTLVHLINMTKE